MTNHPEREMSLEFDDIQFPSLIPNTLSVGRLIWLTIKQPDEGRSWLAALAKHVTSAESAKTKGADQDFRLCVAFTWNGLKAMGVEKDALDTFPEDYREGMPARADILGDTGPNSPEKWVGGLSSPDLHAMVFFYARDKEIRDKWHNEHMSKLKQDGGISILSWLDWAALDPSLPREHFGYRDRISMAQVQGAGVEPTPGTMLLKPGEFILGYESELGIVESLPKPEILSRNGSYVVYRRNRQHVSAFRAFLREHGGPTHEEQELMAAKLMGRWRSGAPLVLAPEKDDPELANDPQRNNNFNYKRMDPYGYACPVSAHIRTVNPRDTVLDPRRRMVRRFGFTYGPALPENSPEDGTDRGMASLFVCASIKRQFEFIQQEWIQDPTFQEQMNERDPIAGSHDGTYDFTIPKKPLAKKIRGLPSFTTVMGGGYFLMPGIKALRFLAGLL